MRLNLCELYLVLCELILCHAQRICRVNTRKWACYVVMVMWYQSKRRKSFADFCSWLKSSLLDWKWLDMDPFINHVRKPRGRESVDENVRICIEREGGLFAYAGLVVVKQLAKKIGIKIKIKMYLLFLFL